MKDKIIEIIEKSELYSVSSGLIDSNTFSMMISELAIELEKLHPAKINHCPNCTAVVNYDDFLGLFVCSECGWGGEIK